MYECNRALCPLCEKRTAVNPNSNSLRKHRVSSRRGAAVCAGSNMIVFAPAEQRFAVAEETMRSFTIEKDNMPLLTTTSQHLATEVTRLIKGAYVTIRPASDVISSYDVQEVEHMDVEWFAIPEIVTDHLTKGQGAWSTVPQYRASCSPDILCVPRGGSNYSRYLAALTLTLDTVSSNDSVKSEVERALTYLQSKDSIKPISVPASAVALASILRASLKVQDAQDGRGRIALWALLSTKALPEYDEALRYANSPTRFIMESLHNAKKEIVSQDIRPDNLRTENQRIGNLLDEVAARHLLK